MLDLIKKYSVKAILFGIIMTAIGFFRGMTVFTFPPIWLDLLKLFIIYGFVFLVVCVLSDWISQKIKKRNNKN